MMPQTLKQKFEDELAKGKHLFDKKDYSNAFYYFERAHILGQPHYFRHVRSHFWMLRVGVRTWRFREIIGQLVRIIGSAGSIIGKYPTGNTGGVNVSPFKKMPIPDDLKPYLD